MAGPIVSSMFRPQKILSKSRINLCNTLAVPALLHGFENWTIKARDARRITAAEMKLMIQLGGRYYIIFSWSLGSQETGKANKNVSD
jgi:hypothetical protein